MRKAINNDFKCGVTETMNLIGGKWKPIILWVLQKGPKRFGILDLYIPSISRKVLTEQLKELEIDGLIERTEYAEIPPRVEYQLSKKGKEISPILKSMCDWGCKNIEEKLKTKKVS
jgi:DNA-binding HxlR family transcriptional regulator